jgi:hypothetical protein
MSTKIAQVRAAMRAEQWPEALRVAARFPRLGEQRGAILSAHGAYTNPRFYGALGADLEALKAAGRAALADRFGE